MKSLKICLFLVILLSLIIIPNVFSIKPVQASTGGLQITLLRADAYIKDTNPNIHIHVFNSSNTLLNGSLVSCNIHLYDVNGGHLQKTNFDIDGIDYNVTLNSNVTKNIGYVPYVIYCNASNQYGFESDVIYISNTGRINTNEGSLWIALIIAFGLMSIFFFYISKIIIDPNLKASKILFFLLGVFNSFMIAYIIYIISVNGYDIISFTPIASTYAYLTGFLLFGFIINYIYAKTFSIFYKNAYRGIGKK